MCAPDDGWRYHPKHVEKFPDINKLCTVASFLDICWNKVTWKYRRRLRDNKERDMKKQYMSDTNWLRVGFVILVFG